MEDVGGQVAMYTEEHARRAQQLEDDLAWARRERRRDNLRMLLGLIVSVCIGIALMSSAVRVNSEDTGRILFWSGLLLGNVGVAASVLWGLHRATERGDAKW